MAVLKYIVPGKHWAAPSPETVTRHIAAELNVLVIKTVAGALVVYDIVFITTHCPITLPGSKLNETNSKARLIKGRRIDFMFRELPDDK